MSEDFTTWYRAQYPSVLAACAALSGDADVAREAADEAFSRAFERWERVGGMPAPGGWVCRVALNCLRRSLRRRRYETMLLRRERGASARAVLPRPDVWAAVRSLPERQRSAVVLRYVADLPEAEIAEAMGVARGTVAATLAAARKHLAVSLGNDVKEAQHG